MNEHPITETDLHAYVDGVLPEARRSEVADYLSARPEDAERVRAYLAQKQALDRLFKPVLDEPLPEDLRALAVPPPLAAPGRRERPALARWALERFAAAILVALLGGLGGWIAHDRYAPAESLALRSPLPRQAAVAHAVFSPDVRRPVEVGAEQEEQLVAWLSKRLGTPIRPPKLGAVGFELIGGRLLPGSNGPVAQFMYQDATGQRLTLYLSGENTANRDTAFRFAQEGQVNVFYWIDGKFGYALSAVIPKAELARIAKAVYDQIEHR